MWHDMSLSFSFICVSCSLLGRAKVYRVLFVFHKTLSTEESLHSWESCGFELQCCIWRLEMSLLFIEKVIGRVCMFMYIQKWNTWDKKVTSMKSFKKSQTCCAPVEPWIATLMNVTLHFPFSWISFIHNNATYVL